jgi:hypothetical protein
MNRGMSDEEDSSLVNSFTANHAMTLGRVRGATFQWMGAFALASASVSTLSMTVFVPSARRRSAPPQ